MSDKTTIEWTDATWNPIRGCSRVSEGCRNCYAERVAARFSGKGLAYEGLAKRTAAGPRWTGKLALAEDRLFDPLRWKRPRRIFVNSMSDLFHERVREEWLIKIFTVMAACRQHTFQVLTKRPARMAHWCELTPYFGKQVRMGYGRRTLVDHTHSERVLPNVWLGISAEDQQTFDERRGALHLLASKGWWTFYSLEPLLGPIDLRYALSGIQTPPHWVIVGGESGHGVRPCEVSWVRGIRDQCVAASVPFFFKQWGEWGPVDPRGFGPGRAPTLVPLGKKKAGALIDGREWRQCPGHFVRLVK